MLVFNVNTVVLLFNVFLLGLISYEPNSFSYPTIILSEETESDVKFYRKYSPSTLFHYYHMVTHSLCNNYSILYPITFISDPLDGEC